MHLLYFRNEVLFQGAQNLLDFDPNFENALSLIVIFRKKNGSTNSTYDDDAFVSSIADK